MPPGMTDCTQWLKLFKTLSNVSDTSSRKQMPPTMAKERNRERKKPQMPPPGFALTPPNGIKCILELTEDAACPEQRKQNADHGGQHAFVGLGGFLRDVAHHFD